VRPAALDLELRLGNPHNALFADSEDRHQEAGQGAQWFGLVLGLRAGICIRPLGPWMLATTRPRTLRFPIVCPYLSIAIGPYGAYIGAKDFGWLPVYKLNGIWPDGKEGDRALTLSASWRRTRV
jgi:hypothetical protein